MSQAQSLDNSPAGAIKAIFTFEDFTNEIQLSNLSLQVTLGDATRTIPLPFKDALLLESTDLNVKSKVQFQLEETDGDIVGYTELKIPGGAFIMNETEVNQKIQFQVVKGPKSSFSTNVRVIFLNKKGVKTTDDQGTKKESTPRMTPSSSKKTLLAETLNKNVTSAKSNRSQDNSPLPKKDSPKLKKELSEQYSISQLINLNKGEKNIPNESFLDESVGQLHLDLDSPAKGRDLDLSADIGSPTKNPKKLSRKGTAEVKEIKPSKKMLKSSLTQVFSPKSSTKGGHPTLYDAVKRLTGDMKSPKKLEKRATMTFGEQIELNEETQVPEVLNHLEQTLGDHDYLKACIEFIKNSMLTTEFKLSEIDMIKSDNEKMKQQVRNVEESKVKLQEKTAASIDVLKQENDQLREKIALLTQQTEDINNKYHGSQNEIIKLQENIARHGVTITQKDNDLMSAELKFAELIDTRAKLKRAEETLTRVEGQRINDQKNFNDSLERARKAFEEAKVLYDKTAQEKREVSMQLSEERLAHTETRNKLVLLERQLENAEAYKEVIKSLEVQRDELLRQLAELRADRDGVNINSVYKLIEKTQADMGLKFREYERRENDHIEKAKIAEEYMKAFEFKYTNLEQELDKSELNVSQLNTKLVEMEELQTSHDKIAEEVERLKEKLTHAVQHSVNLNSGIDNITENHDAMAQRTLELERANNDLIEVIAEKQNEIVFLKNSLAAAINEIPRYVPIKDDPVDAALANILNTNKDAEKYRLLFIRETEGVYQFGTKKIYIKIEGERVLIRVGGGYMTLEELLETIAPVEYDKLAKYSKTSQDQASNLVAKNIVLNQVISGKCVNSLEKPKTQAYKYTSKSGVTPKADPAMKNSFSGKISKPF